MPGEAVQRLRMQSTDFDQVSATLDDAFGDVRLRRNERGGLRLAMQDVSSAELSVGRWSLDGVAGGTTDRSGAGSDTFLTVVRLAGSFHVWSGSRAMDPGRPYLYPEVTDSELEQPAAATLAISRDAVDRYARTIADRDDLSVRFLDVMPADREHDVVWRSTMTAAATALDALVDLPDAALVTAPLTDFVIATLLRTFPNTATDAGDARDRPMLPSAAIRRAVAFIDDHLGAPITVQDLAVAAGFSRRGLHIAFVRDLGVTPMAYVRRARLAAAHAELLRGDPASLSIAVVARRWGFTDAAHFGRLYRQAYGMTPRRTLES